MQKGLIAFQRGSMTEVTPTQAQYDKDGTDRKGRGRGKKAPSEEPHGASAVAQQRRTRDNRTLIRMHNSTNVNVKRKNVKQSQR